MKTRLFSACAVLALLASASPVAFAHAVLMRSTPADGSTIHNGDVEITLDYNSRIESSRCTVTLTGPRGQNISLTPQSPENPAELKALASHLTSGKYLIHWQVLATDGHITRGDISFIVTLQ